MFHFETPAPDCDTGSRIGYPLSVPDIFETAPTGRSKCRGCAQPIAKGEIRFGEKAPNPFAEGEMTLWFHPLCAAYKRPEPLLQALSEAEMEMPDRQRLEDLTRATITHRRLVRIDGAERAKRGQAKCRHCKEPIAQGDWRIRLVFFEDAMFGAGGFVHLHCRTAYFETEDVTEQVLHFTFELSDEERAALRMALETKTG